MCVANRSATMSTFSTFPSLTCCGGSPLECQTLTKAKKCPKGYDPQFCCSGTGQITPASIGADSYGDVITTCNNYGDVPYNGYDPGVCKKAPVTQCCNNGTCYTSKDPDCNYYGSGNPTVGGMTVSDCTQCYPGSAVSCCFPGQICQINDVNTGCPSAGSYQVADCNACPSDEDYFNYW